MEKLSFSLKLFSGNFYGQSFFKTVWGPYNTYKTERNKVVSELRKSKYYYEKDLAARIKTANKLFWIHVWAKTKTKLT